MKSCHEMQRVLVNCGMVRSHSPRRKPALEISGLTSFCRRYSEKTVKRRSKDGERWQQDSQKTVENQRTKAVGAHGKGSVLTTKPVETQGKGSVLATKAVDTKGKASCKPRSGRGRTHKANVRLGTCRVSICAVSLVISARIRTSFA